MIVFLKDTNNLKIIPTKKNSPFPLGDIMIDEKDPRPEWVNVDSSDDEAIIDLTDEVTLKPDDQSGIFDLTEDMADDSSEASEKEIPLDFEPEDEADVPGATTEIESSIRGIGTNRAIEFTEVEDGDDQSIASALKEPLWNEEDFAPKSAEAEIKIDNSSDAAFDGLDPTDTAAALEAKQQEDAFELDNEIEPECGPDEGEADWPHLDLERTDDTEDFVSMVLDDPKVSRPDDDDYEPTEYLEIDDEELDDIVLPADDHANDAEATPAPSNETLDLDNDDDDYEPTEYLEINNEELDDIVPPADDHEDDAEAVPAPSNETLDPDNNDDLPDLEAISEFDIEENGEAAEEMPRDAQESENDIIPGDFGRDLDPGDDRAQEMRGETDTLELEDIDNFPGLVDAQEDDPEIVSLIDDEPLPFEDEDDSLDLDDGLDLVNDDEVIPLDSFNLPALQDTEEIIEITEFDQHFPAESETLLKQTGILDTSRAEEDDFLELIDVEENKPAAEDEEVVEFSDPSLGAPNENGSRPFGLDLAEGDSLPTSPDSIFSNDYEAGVLPAEDSKPMLKSLADRVSEFDEALTEPAAELADSGIEATPASEDLFSETEDIDYKFDPGAIAQQVDRLDTFLPDDQPDEPEVASLPVDHPEENDTRKTATDGAHRDGDPDESPAIPAGQIDAAIERVITEKFAGKIEDIIYDVIEKAVAKEIDRLKGVLLGNSPIDSDPD